MDDRLAALLVRAADGDVDAFASFYDATASVVWCLELRRCGTTASAVEAA